jgi:hypothetical protein
MSENLPLTIFNGVNSTQTGTQTGAVNLGSIDSKLTLEGKTGINLIGGLKIQYNNINSGVSQFELLDSHHLAEISNPLTTSIMLPDANGREGKLFIISKNYIGGSLIINTQPADKIDGDDTFELNILSERISLISSGDNKWLII